MKGDGKGTVLIRRWERRCKCWRYRFWRFFKSMLVYTKKYCRDFWESWYGKPLLFVPLLCVNFCFWFIIPSLLEMCCTTTEGVQDLKNLILSTGSALIAAVAIVTSFVLFSMQVNIERVSHGLFRILSTDGRLFFRFALAFLLAIGISSLSILLSHESMALIVPLALSMTLFMPFLLVYAHQRALELIDPLQQLKMIVQDVRNRLGVWAQRDRKKASAPRQRIVEQEELAVDAMQNISHAVSLARYYAKREDYETSASALAGVIEINITCTNIKNEAFHTVRSRIVNKTLGCLQQYVQTAIEHQNEEQIVQALRAIENLVHRYSEADYTDSYDDPPEKKFTECLIKAVQKTVPCNMVNVLSTGQNIMGVCARASLSYWRRPTSRRERSLRLFIYSSWTDDKTAKTLSEGIVSVSRQCMKENYWPVVGEGLTQLAMLTAELLKFGEHGSYDFDHVCQDAASVIEGSLEKADKSDAHRDCLELYYTTLERKLEELVSGISPEEQLSIPGGKEITKESVIQNIELWAANLVKHRTEENLLRKAKEKDPEFVKNLTCWIMNVTKTLLIVANAPACDKENGKKLRGHAHFLSLALRQIFDRKAIVLVTDKLLEVAAHTHSSCPHSKIIKEIGDDLLFWIFKAEETGCWWAPPRPKKGLFSFLTILLRNSKIGSAFSKLAKFALAGGDEEVSQLKTKIGKCLSGKDAPEQNIRDRAAKEIRKHTREPQKDSSSILSYTPTLIEQAASKKLRHLLKEIATLLSPDTPAKSP